MTDDFPADDLEAVGFEGGELREPDQLQTTLHRVIELIRGQGATLATAESLTGGMVGSALTDVPGVSAIYRGGVIVYATDLKATLAGVPADLLADVGPVHPDTAAALAAGVRERLGATYGLATTGVAGPDSQAGIKAGTVYVAAAGPTAVMVRKLSLDGDRETVRRGSVQAVLELAAELVVEDPGSPAR
jgi:nicotinamide-nucleotide amidase